MICIIFINLFPEATRTTAVVQPPKKMSKTALVNILGKHFSYKKVGWFLRFKLATFVEGKFTQPWTRFASGSSTRISGTMYDQYPQCTGLVCHLVIDGRWWEKSLGDLNMISLNKDCQMLCETKLVIWDVFVKSTVHRWSFFSLWSHHFWWWFNHESKKNLHW